MTEILRVTKNKAFVKVNGREFKIDNINIESQLKFMESVVPEPKKVFSFAQFGESPQLLQS